MQCWLSLGRRGRSGTGGEGACNSLKQPINPFLFILIAGSLILFPESGILESIPILRTAAGQFWNKLVKILLSCSTPLLRMI